jgi:hypothetical protein
VRQSSEAFMNQSTLLQGNEEDRQERERLRGIQGVEGLRRNSEDLWKTCNAWLNQEME